MIKEFHRVRNASELCTKFIARVWALRTLMKLRRDIDHKLMLKLMCIKRMRSQKFIAKVQKMKIALKYNMKKEKELSEPRQILLMQANLEHTLSIRQQAEQRVKYFLRSYLWRFRLAKKVASFAQKVNGIQ